MACCDREDKPAQVTNTKKGEVEVIRATAMKQLVTASLFVFFLGYVSLWHIPHCCGAKPFISKQTLRIADFVYEKLR